MNAFPFDRLLDWPFLLFLIIVIVLLRFRNEVSGRISSISELTFGDRLKISLGGKKPATETVKGTSSDELAQSDAPMLPADDIRLAYENLDWERHWPKFVSFALMQEGGVIRKEVYDSFAELNGTQACKLLNDRLISIDIDDHSFNRLKSLKLIKLTLQEPSFIQNVGAAIAFLIPLGFGVSIISSDFFLEFLYSIIPNWFGAWFVFVPIGLIFLFFFLLFWLFRKVLNPDVTKKTVTLTQTGEEFLRNDAGPTLADYLRESGL